MCVCVGGGDVAVPLAGREGATLNYVQGMLLRSLSHRERPWPRSFFLLPSPLARSASGYGGCLAVLFDSAATLSGCVVRNCSSADDGGGAAARNSSLVLEGTEVSSCSAVQPLAAENGGDSADGGGISGARRQGDARARKEPGPRRPGHQLLNSTHRTLSPRFPAALFSPLLSLADSTVRDCFTDGGGGGVHSTQSVAALSNATLSGNTATGGDGGGALFLGFPCPAGANVDTELLGYWRAYCSRASGGELETGQLHITLTDATVERNSAGGSGGGVLALMVQGPEAQAPMWLELQRGRVAGNTAGVSGGGVAAVNLLSLQVAATELVNNTCSGGTVRAWGLPGGGRAAETRSSSSDLCTCWQGGMMTYRLLSSDRPQTTSCLTVASFHTRAAGSGASTPRRRSRPPSSETTPRAPPRAPSAAATAPAPAQP